MKHLVRLTESDIYRIVKHAIIEAVDETTIKQASVGGIYNILSMNDIKNDNDNVTFGSGNKLSYDRLEKSNDIEWKLLTKAILDSMGNFTFYFIQPDGCMGNKTVRLTFESILGVGNNGFILFGTAKISGKRLVRNKWVDDIRKIKVFYNAEKKIYSWVNTYKINNERYIRATKTCNLFLPKGSGHELLENKNHEEQLFSNINSYVDFVNASISSDLHIKLKL